MRKPKNLFHFLVPIALVAGSVAACDGGELEILPSATGAGGAQPGVAGAKPGGGFTSAGSAGEGGTGGSNAAGHAGGTTLAGHPNGGSGGKVAGGSGGSTAGAAGKAGGAGKAGAGGTVAGGAAGKAGAAGTEQGGSAGESGAGGDETGGTGGTDQGGAGGDETAGTGGTEQGGTGGDETGGTGGTGGSETGGTGGSETGGSGGSPTIGGLPADIANKFALWLDASDAATVKTSAGVVTEWDSRIGSATVIAPDPAGQTEPTYATPAAGVLFDGTHASDLVLNGDLSGLQGIDFTQPYEIFVAAQDTANDGAFHTFVGAMNAGNLSDIFYVLDAPTTSFLAFSGATYPGPTNYTFPVPAQVGFRVVELRVNTASGALYVDAPTTPTESAIAVTPLAPLSQPTTLAIGWFPFAHLYPLQGAIGEVIITQRLAATDLDADDVSEALIRAYLTTKWNPLSDNVIPTARRTASNTGAA